MSQEADFKPLGLKNTVKICGVKEVMITFLCYCSLEQTAGLWTVSYIVLEKGLDADVAAKWGALFYLGITAGRFFAGFISDKLGDKNMVRLGIGIISAGIVMIILPFGMICTLIGLLTVGIGCAPIYPCVIHSIPNIFGSERSQAIIGVQMASAYVGNILMPPLFGWIAENISIRLFPVYLIVILILMVVMHKRMLLKQNKM